VAGQQQHRQAALQALAARHQRSGRLAARHSLGGQSQVADTPPLWLTEMLGTTAGGSRADSGGDAAACGGTNGSAGGSRGEADAHAPAGGSYGGGATSAGAPASAAGHLGGFRPYTDSGASTGAAPAVTTAGRYHGAPSGAGADVTSARAAKPPALPLGITGLGSSALRRINSSELSAIIGLVAAGWTNWGKGRTAAH
jgi:hypothetical protein